jgi:hypothetical protein
MRDANREALMGLSNIKITPDGQYTFGYTYTEYEGISTTFSDLTPLITEQIANELIDGSTYASIDHSQLLSDDGNVLLFKKGVTYETLSEFINKNIGTVPITPVNLCVVDYYACSITNSGSKPIDLYALFNVSSIIDAATGNLVFYENNKPLSWADVRLLYYVLSKREFAVNIENKEKMYSYFNKQGIISEEVYKELLNPVTKDVEGSMISHANKYNDQKWKLNDLRFRTNAKLDQLKGQLRKNNIRRYTMSYTLDELVNVMNDMIITPRHLTVNNNIISLHMYSAKFGLNPYQYIEMYTRVPGIIGDGGYLTFRKFRSVSDLYDEIEQTLRTSKLKVDRDTKYHTSKNCVLMQVYTMLFYPDDKYKDINYKNNFKGFFKSSDEVSKLVCERSTNSIP